MGKTSIRGLAVCSHLFLIFSKLIYVEGSYVYLVAKYTDDRNQAACGFSLFTTYVEDLCANDISKGDGKELFRYIHVHYHPNNSGQQVVGSVYLKEEKLYDGHTDDLNKDRGGRYLYLCWDYAD
jgi:hypothetical protein